MKVVYLASEYPGISHTFIQREIQTLRAEGFTVHTASVRRPSNIVAMTATDHTEYEQTVYLRENLLRRGFSALCRLLIKLPWAMSLLIFRGLCRCILDGPKNPVKAVAYILEAAVLLEYMRANGIEHVHVHFANPAATVALIASESGLVHNSISAHGPDIFYDTRENLLPLKAEKAVFVRCISHYCVSQFMRILPAYLWDKLRIVRCGVDTEIFIPPSSAKERGEETVRFLCLGRICPAKAQPLLLNAFARLLAEGQSAVLTFVGGGEGLDPLRAAARKLGVEEQVVFSGAVDQDTARRMYDDADVFVLPSVAEGVPVVLMEAMAKEIPCIGTNITGIPELIEHGRDGLLATPGDVESLLDCLRLLAGDGVLREQLGKAGRQKVLARYDLATNGKQMAMLFTDFLSGSSKQFKKGA